MRGRTGTTDEGLSPLARRTPDGPPPAPTVQRIRLRYTKRGRLRFTSHRDFQRAFERALRRSAVPMAYSAGFTPHPKVSYANAAPTGTASEAEYLEIGLAEHRDPEALRRQLDASLPPGLDVTDAVEVATSNFVERLEASEWLLRLPGVEPVEAEKAAAVFLAAEAVEVQRMTKNGLRTFDARSAVAAMEIVPEGSALVGIGDNTATDGADDVRPGAPCAILRLVVRHATPAVRPDDVLSGLRSTADLAPPVPAEVTRLAQGPLDEQTGTVTDPLALDRAAAEVGR
ncbi:radical SAM-linked protein [Kitasatospora cineracea]|uniref:Radical SAM-linked protein n=1 Tax=Kitasatospora cineracea TaxID=88074 RepID=A0A3N4RUN3_9ACTN|nr:radical SAM-linked protein [Kitasatospora cineracea]